MSSQLLLRLIDDFLFITSERSLAERFLKTMSIGQPEYGCVISPDKTVVNFDAIDQHGMPVRKTSQYEGEDAALCQRLGESWLNSSRFCMVRLLD